MTGRTTHRRCNEEQLLRYSQMLSDRHRKWGDDCPAVDLDYLLAEYNHGVTVGIVDYKHHTADLSRTNERTYQALSDLYDRDGNQHPFFVARYWPDMWAFRVKGFNDRARAHLCGDDWMPFSEQQYVRMLYRLRKDALDRRDLAYIAQLNNIPPPREEQAA